MFRESVIGVHGENNTKLKMYPVRKMKDFLMWCCVDVT
jgi:hypothetical protein